MEHSVIHIPSNSGFVIIPAVDVQPTHCVFWTYEMKDKREFLCSTDVCWTDDVSVEKVVRINAFLHYKLGKSISQNCYALKLHKEVVRRSNEQKYQTALKKLTNLYNEKLHGLRGNLFEASLSMEINTEYKIQVENLKQRYNLK